ncbi:hypothetical protein EVG20_g4676 [Dentipellis fragilis]|uniref:Uncharacterized protein n=1 Tax=Dentipellis fragilis TaxID=205917 RepID=A0A4Y9YVU1_9AGAM|nr:hypothetical protein EVG20_g4676 [Dentipellis fragilis]
MTSAAPPPARTPYTRTHAHLARSLSDGAALYSTGAGTGRSPPSEAPSASRAQGAPSHRDRDRAHGTPSHKAHAASVSTAYSGASASSSMAHGTPVPSSRTSAAPSSRMSGAPHSKAHGTPSRETSGAPSKTHGAPSAYKAPSTPAPAPPPSAYAHAYDSRPISSAASSSSHTSDFDSIASTYPSTVASVACDRDQWY